MISFTFLALQIDGHGKCSPSCLEEDKENWRDRAEVVTKLTHNAYNEYAKELLADVVNSVPIMAVKQNELVEKRLASLQVNQIADSDSGKMTISSTALLGFVSELYLAAQ